MKLGGSKGLSGILKALFGSRRPRFHGFSLILAKGIDDCNNKQSSDADDWNKDDR